MKKPIFFIKKIKKIFLRSRAGTMPRHRRQGGSRGRVEKSQRCCLFLRIRLQEFLDVEREIVGTEVARH
jgi:hypothetical protein